MTATHTPGPWEVFTPADPAQGRRVTAVVTCPYCKGAGIPARYKRKKCSRCNGTGRDQYAPPTIASGFAQQHADGQEWAEESLANARLIAAAPDLLAALKECRRAMNQLGIVGDPAQFSADEAIAKAEGTDQ